MKSRPNLYWCGDREPPSTFNIAGQPRSDPKDRGTGPPRRAARPDGSQIEQNQFLDYEGHAKLQLGDFAAKAVV